MKNHEPDICSLQQLEAEIRRVKVSIKRHEKGLEDRLKVLPQQALKATAQAVIPFAISNTVASKSFSLVKVAASALFGKTDKTKGTAKQQIFANAKQLGLFAVAKALFGLWKKQ